MAWCDLAGEEFLNSCLPGALFIARARAMETAKGTHIITIYVFMKTQAREMYHHFACCTGDMQVAEDYIRFCCQFVLSRCKYALMIGVAVHSSIAALEVVLLYLL